MSQRTILVKYVDIIWVDYNDLTATSLKSWVISGNHPQMAFDRKMVAFFRFVTYCIILYL